MQASQSFSESDAGEQRRPALEIVDLRVSAEDREIVKGVSLAIYPGELHAIMGPNGSGKSTLAAAIAGKPSLNITGGKIYLRGEDITEMSPDERGRAGLFLAFQYPEEVPGVTILQMLRAALSQRKGQNYAAFELRMMIRDALQDLQMDPSFADRYVNEGFSGGEKKRCEILQLAVLQPAVAILDETDSGLDIDALRIVAEGVDHIRSKDPELALLVITHYQRILRYLKPDRVHVLVDGRIVASGGSELAEELEAEGYERFVSAAGVR